MWDLMQSLLISLVADLVELTIPTHPAAICCVTGFPTKQPVQQMSPVLASTAYHGHELRDSLHSLSMGTQHTTDIVHINTAFQNRLGACHVIAFQKHGADPLCDCRRLRIGRLAGSSVQLTSFCKMKQSGSTRNRRVLGSCQQCRA